MHVKPRQPGTFARAVMEAIDLCGVQALADVCEVSTSLVAQWSQDDNPRLPNSSQALKLDEYVKAHTGRSPMHDLHGSRLERIHAPTVAMELRDAALEAVAGVGHFAEAVRRAKAPTGPGGHRLTDNEKSEIADNLTYLRRVLDKVEASLSVEGTVAGVTILPLKADAAE